VPIVYKCGSLNLLDSKGLSRPVMGLLFNFYISLEEIIARFYFAHTKLPFSKMEISIHKNDVKNYAKNVCLKLLLHN
jgi:hypothetical protein